VKSKPPPHDADPDATRNWVDVTLAACLQRVNRRDFARQLLRTLVVAVAVAIVLKVSVRSYEVDGTSMLPGLKSSDHLLVDQLTYHFRAPRRGEIVVFRFPHPWLRQDLVKRVIGVPGDVVEVQPGGVTVNGHRLNESYVRNIAAYHYGPARVPPGEYFVLGDNRETNGREISYDSHQWGFLPASDIYGRLLFTYWPPADFGSFSL
jgi:signal peptidase I